MARWTVVRGLVVVDAGRQCIDVRVQGQVSPSCHAGRREFDRQGEAVEAVAEAGHGGAVGGGEGEAGEGLGGSVGEEGEGRVAVGRGEVAVRVGDRQRPYVQQVFLRQAQAAPAGREDTDAGGPVQERADEFGAGPVQVLAVVEDQEQPTGSHVFDQGVQRLEVVQAQRFGGGPWDEVRVVEVGQVHETDAVREGAGHPGRDACGEAGLADAARTGQRDEAGPGQQRAYFGLFVAAVDEAR